MGCQGVAFLPSVPIGDLLVARHAAGATLVARPHRAVPRSRRKPAAFSLPVWPSPVHHACKPGHAEPPRVIALTSRNHRRADEEPALRGGGSRLAGLRTIPIWGAVMSDSARSVEWIVWHPEGGEDGP